MKLSFNRNIIILTVLFSFWTCQALAASGITYHGRILRPDGSGVDGQFAGFRLRVMDGNAGTCQMYEEIRTKDMRTSNGTFSIAIGDGGAAGTFGVSGISLFDELFLNNRTFNFIGGHPCAGSPYAADVRDNRVLNVSFRETPASPWEDLPPMSIAHVPFAYSSLVSQKVGTHDPSSLLRVENAGSPSAAAALTPANFTELLALLNGTTTQYIKSVSATAGHITASTVAGAVSLSLPGVGTAGTYGSATQVPVITTDAQGRITSVVNTTITGVGGGITDLTGDVTASGAGSVAATIANDAVTTVKILDASVTTDKLANLSVTDAKLAANSVITTKILDANVTLDKLASDSVNSSKIVDNSITGSDISTTAALSVASIAATGNVGAGTITTRSLGLFELPGNGTESITLQAPAALAGSTIYTLPATDGANGDVLSTNSSGVLSWTTPGSPGDASYAAKGVVRFDTDAATSGITVAAGVAKLANSGVAANTYGAAATVPVLTVDAFGRVTSVTDTAIALNASAITAGILPIARGGTNSTTALNNNRIMVSSGGAIVEAAALTNGQLLIGSTGAAPVAASLTAGSGITITPSAGGITIANSMSAPVDASHAAKGIVQFDTDTATSGISVTAGVAKIATGGVATGMISDDAVNFSKMQNIATNKLLGRGTALSGDVEEITLGTGLSLTGTTLNSSGIAAVTNTANLANTKIWIGDAGGKAQEFALSGDVTMTAGGLVTVANDAVSFAKIQNITDNKILGRSAGSNGDMQEITIGTGLSMAAGTLSATATAPGDASYAAKGIVQFDTNAATSGITVAAGVAKLANSGVAANTYGAAATVPVLTVDTFGRVTSVTDTAIALNASAITAGILPIARGGTNSTTALNNNRMMVSSAGAIVEAAPLTDGQILIGSTGAAPVAASLTAGSGITITPSAGGISIAATATAPGDASYAAKGIVQFDTDAATSGMTVAAGVAKIATGGVVTGMIANDAVSFAKMQNISTNKLLGRGTALSGDVEEITLGTGLSLTGTTLNSSGIAAVTNTADLANTKIWIGDAGGKAQEFALSGDVTMTAGGLTTVDATSANTASKIIKRDVSGNFVAGAGTFNTSVAITDGAVGGAVTISAPSTFTSYNLTLPADDGGPNQFLQTNGAGVLSWAAAGGGSGDALVANPLSQFAATTSAQLSGVLSDETGTGAAVFGTSPTFITNILTPMIVGGTGTTQSLTFKTTTGVGTTGADHIFQVGNNGGTEAMRILNNGRVGIGTSGPAGLLNVTNGAVGVAGHIDMRVIGNGATSDTYGVGVHSGTGGQFNVTSEQGSMRQAMVFSDAGAVGDTFFGLSSSTDSGATWLPRLTVKQSGNVGIGTAAPGYKLDVAGDVNVTGNFKINGTNISTSGVGGSGTTGYLPRFTAASTVGNSMIYDSGSAIAIGHSSPGSTLDIATPSASLDLRSTTGTNYAYMQTRNGSGTARFGVEGSTSNGIATASTPYATIFGSSSGHATQFTTDGIVRMTVLPTSGNVGIGTSSPQGILDLSSTSSAFLPPRMSTGQRDAIGTPIAGMVIYNTTTSNLNYYNGSAWSGSIDFATTTTPTVGTIYQATAAGIVTATGARTAGTCVLTGYTDATATPSTILARNSSATSLTFSLSFPVKAGNYYQVTASSCSTSSMTFTALSGSGGSGGGGGGIASCPAGMTMVGDSGKHATFCIDTNERSGTEYEDAANDCAGINDATLGHGHLCTKSEWHVACRNSSMSSKNDDWELVDDLADYGYVVVAGFGTCGATDMTSFTGGVGASFDAYRCCIK